MTERTLVLVKPDGVQRLLVGRVLQRYEDRGLKLIGLKLVKVDRALAEAHYAVHRERPFFDSLVEFITSSPLVAAVSLGRLMTHHLGLLSVGHPRAIEHALAGAAGK